MYKTSYKPNQTPENKSTQENNVFFDRMPFRVCLWYKYWWEKENVYLAQILGFFII